MRFLYTDHVRLRIRQREMRTTHIERTILAPEQTEPSFKLRTVVQRHFGSRTLEVVYRKLNSHVVIITAYWLDEGA